MSLSFAVTTADLGRTQPRLGRLVAGLSDTGRAHLHEMILGRVLELTREHLREIAQTRHDTANKLGASPTGHWAQAAEKTSGTYDETAATVTVSQPGIGRVAHPITILPGPGKEALTLPLIAPAYGQRAYRVPGLFVWKSPTSGNAFLAQSEGHPGALVLWYLLVKSVVQEQDRTLLPSDELYRAAALQGCVDYADYLLAA
jgi:hypothetical protein